MQARRVDQLSRRVERTGQRALVMPAALQRLGRAAGARGDDERIPARLRFARAPLGREHRQRQLAELEQQTGRDLVDRGGEPPDPVRKACLRIGSGLRERLRQGEQVADHGTITSLLIGHPDPRHLKLKPDQRRRLRATGPRRRNEQLTQRRHHPRRPGLPGPPLAAARPFPLPVSRLAPLAARCFGPLPCGWFFPLPVARLDPLVARCFGPLAAGRSGRCPGWLAEQKG